MAEGSGAVWTMQVSGNHDDGSAFITAMFTYAGGVGARSSKPGLDACSYPTGVAAVPVEVVEASAPIRFARKALRAGSGGAGRQTGGLGQTIEFDGRKWTISGRFAAGGAAFESEVWCPLEDLQNALKRQDLVRPMVTGFKRLPAAMAARAPRLGSPWLALLLLAVAAGVVAAIARQG